MDVHIPFKGTVAITGAGADAAARQAGEGNKQVIFRNCPPFTDCINEMNNVKIDNAKIWMLRCQCLI